MKHEIVGKPHLNMHDAAQMVSFGLFLPVSFTVSFLNNFGHIVTLTQKTCRNSNKDVPYNQVPTRLMLDMCIVFFM